MRRWLNFVLVFTVMLLCTTAHAQEPPSDRPTKIELQIATGQVSPDIVNFKSAAAIELLLRYTPEKFPINFDIGYNQFGQFDHTTAFDTYIDIDGYLLGVSKPFPLTKHMAVGLGVYTYNYKSKAVVLGLDKGITSDNSLALHIDGVYNFTKIAIVAGWRWYQDVSGTEITALMIGMKLKL